MYRLPPETFPVSFREDLDRLVAWLGQPDILDDESYRRALRPETVRQYRIQLLRFASELVHAGVAVTDLVSVRNLLGPALAERGLRQMLARNGGETSRHISEMARLLGNLANKLIAPEVDRAALSRLAGKLAVRPQVGMTPKNRGRLRVLQEPRHQTRILNLPDKVFARPVKSGGHRLLVAREDALAIAILLNCPIRVKNLAALELVRHIQRPGDGKVYLVLEEEDTKTGRAIEFELPCDVVRLLDAHLATRAPHLCPHGTPYLFPQRTGAAPIQPSCLAGRIAKRVRRETGLEMNVHLFRHFAVMLSLDANPGGYEVARRLLGHSDLSHTINMYSGLEVRTATRAYSDLMAELKAGKR
ncbi:phage integrase family protein [Palleronia aestuarii]|uniref:Phage integrase family protein n=1 Tax=Palleronia aestuarii TaxID=568105 RepID=A0A2W7MQU7_9RHOB|nr:site-specific integrase [Palleronia aestuarii]PZX09943.1 phage integrase family protein [Palleronia aestuarii]